MLVVLEIDCVVGLLVWCHNRNKAKDSKVDREENAVDGHSAETDFDAVVPPFENQQDKWDCVRYVFEDRFTDSGFSEALRVPFSPKKYLYSPKEEGCGKVDREGPFVKCVN